MDTEIVALKLVLTPIFIVAVTLAGRRFGHAVSGWLSGLPLTSGPISVFLSLEQGTDFAAEAAVGTLAGLVPVLAFMLAYSWAMTRYSWWAALSCGWIAFLALAVPATQLPMPFWIALSAMLVALVIVLASLPRPKDMTGLASRPRWDLAARALVATGLVVTLTGAAAALGPTATGVLSPTPVFATILGAFEHRHDGPGAAQRVIRGITIALLAFAGFFAVVHLLLPRTELWIAYLAGAMTALVLNGATFRFIDVPPRLADPA